MKFETLKLFSFKKYADHFFSFVPGLNVFFGPNEAGKTTLHHGMITALWGIGSKSDYLLTSKAEAKSLGSSVSPQLDLGFALGEKKFSIHREIESGDVTLFQLSPQKTVVANEQKRVLKFIAEKTGISSAQLFNQTISIQTGEFLEISNISSVGEAVEKNFSGGDRIALSRVYGELKAYRKSLKKMRNEKPGEIDHIEEEIDACQKKIHDHQELIKEFTLVAEKKAQYEEVLPKKKQRVQELESILEKYKKSLQVESELASLRKKYKEVDEVLKGIKIQKSKVREAEMFLETYTKLDAHRNELETFHKELFAFEHAKLRFDEEQKRKQEEHDRIAVIVSNSKHSLSKPSLFSLVIGVVFSIVLFEIFKSSWALLAIIPFLLFALYYSRQLLKYYYNSMKPKDNSFSDEIIENYEKTKKIVKKRLHLFGIEIPDFTPDMVRNKIKEYEETHAIYAKEKQGLRLLKDQKDEESLQAERDELTRKGNELRAQKEDLIAADIGVEKVEKWKNEFAILSKQVQEEEAKLNELNGKYETLKKQVVSVQEEKARLEYLKNRKELLSKNLEAVLLSEKILHEVEDEHHAEYLPVLERKSSTYFSNFTHGAYPSLELTASWPKIYMKSENGDKQTKHLSSGTKDQLYLALRLALAEMLSSDINLPIILDDPFVQFDATRKAEGLKILSEISKTRQVILFTASENIEREMPSVGNTRFFELKV